MGRWGIRGLETRMRRESSISRGGGPNSTVEVYVSEESKEGESQCYGRGSSSKSELPRALNFDKESCEHLRWTHLEQAQHCTDLPCQVTFPAHTEQGKMEPGLG